MSEVVTDHCAETSGLVVPAFLVRPAPYAADGPWRRVQALLASERRREVCLRLHSAPALKSG